MSLKISRVRNILFFNFECRHADFSRNVGVETPTYSDVRLFAKTEGFYLKLSIETAGLKLKVFVLTEKPVGRCPRISNIRRNFVLSEIRKTQGHQRFSKPGERVGRFE